LAVEDWTPGRGLSWLGGVTLGTRHTFRCARCEYEAEASGGKDYGMAAILFDTMVCTRCRELVDVVIGTACEDMELPEDVKRQLGRCPECHRKRSLEPWPKSRPCPQCGGRMRKVPGAWVLWD
jgi:Zn finger protein HypA/HybF involved in hydrogenase expression